MYTSLKAPLSCKSYCFPDAFLIHPSLELLVVPQGLYIVVFLIRIFLESVKSLSRYTSTTDRLFASIYIFTTVCMHKLSQLYIWHNSLNVYVSILVTWCIFHSHWNQYMYRWYHIFPLSLFSLFFSLFINHTMFSLLSLSSSNSHCSIISSSFSITYPYNLFFILPLPFVWKQHHIPFNLHFFLSTYSI